ncbi:MAG: hypothetical protein IPP28_15085 [Xanthomonadales bacterium]|nr:hypothetical protein [Xanthomonadales bacterium]
MILRWWRYFWEKRAEVAALDWKDAELARIVLRIHRHRRSVDWRHVPLRAIAPIHPINRPTALAAATERAERIRPIAEVLRAEGRIGRERLHEVLPSVSAIKLVETAPGRFVSYEGNGRLAALRPGLRRPTGPADRMRDLRHCALTAPAAPHRETAQGPWI